MSISDNKKLTSVDDILSEPPKDSFGTTLHKKPGQDGVTATVVPKETFFELSEEELNIPIRRTFFSRVLQQLLPALILVWDEVLFHLYVNGGAKDLSILYITFFAAAIGFFYAAMTGLLNDRAATVVSSITIALLTFWFIVQTFYQRIFNNYLTWSVMGNAGDAKQFWKAGLRSLWARMPLVLILLAPIAVWILLRRKGFRHKKLRTFTAAVPLLGAFLSVMIAFLIMSGGKAKANGRYEIFFDQWQADRGIRENGVLVGLVQDLYHTATYRPEDIGKIVLIDQPTIQPPPITTPTPSEPLTPEPTRMPNHTPTPTPTPVDRSPQVLDIDFAALAASEPNETLATIHEYLASTQPTTKNEFTGMFEGYNVIMLTCETLSPLAVDSERTPTLYKLIHSGFYFDNFYTPYWITSTSDAEYTVCTGLLPDLQMSNSFSRSAANVMPCTLGHIFRGMGYTTYAFHNHDAKYYDRDKSHPNMGYTFVAKWAGLKITDQFPESDLEMMEQSIPMYINEDHFHAYYMTMSGHMEYEWDGNDMGKKHRDEVKDLPYSEQAKCYLAGNIELENALKYLIDELTAAGKLDNTLIVITGDHYPYGLSEDQRNELAGHKQDQVFELYKNHLVIWNPNIEPMTISKAACSLDVMPTILNLLGIDFDSRLYMGTDIFSDSLGLVQFKDNSFLTDYVRYDANTGESEWLNGADGWDSNTKLQYIESYKIIVRNKFNISRAMLNNNYYATVDSLLWWRKSESLLEP